MTRRRREEGRFADMSRRLVLVVLLIGLVAIGSAVAPWTVSDALTGAIAHQLREAYGLELRVAGRSTVALLPVPRLKFDDVTIANRDGVPIVRGGQLRGEFRLVPLLAGRMELAEASLSGSAIEVALDGSGRHGLTDTLGLLRDQAERRRTASAPVRRLALQGARIVVRDARAGADRSVEDVNLVAIWPTPDASLELSGTLSWRDEVVDFSLSDLRPGALVGGKPSRFAARVKSPTGALTIAGEVSAEARAGGTLSFTTRSFGDVSRLTGVGFAGARTPGPVSVEGEFTADRRAISLGSARLVIGADRLEGALALRFDGDRPAVSGTLASDRLDLGALLAPATRALRSDAGWSGEPWPMAELTGADLDLRLSAAVARIGPVTLDDVAGGLLVKQGRLEASLGRAGLYRGVAKGRLTASTLSSRADVRLQGSLDGVEVGSLLADVGHGRWLSGPAQAQFVLEGAGESAAEVVAQTHGRASVSVKQGELIGIGVADLMRRVERRPVATALDWRGGRTPFDHAAATINVVSGVGDIVEGSFVAPTARGSVQGRVSLVERTLALRAALEPLGAAPASSISFDITGPMHEPSVVPDLRGVVGRSGAAGPLLGRESTAAATRALGYAPTAQ
jgi:AsmA protein